MEMITEFHVQTTVQSRINEVDFDQLEFGKYIADHMLVCDYADGVWQQPEIVPYADITVSPSALALHYGQTVFEGMKAFRMSPGPGGIDGRINIFRIEKHYSRFVKSLERMCMAVVPKDIFIEGLKQLIELDKAWVPSKTGHALYLRPFVFASEARFGVKVSEAYRFIVFTGPVPSLYADPIKVKVETHYIRAARGGTGFAKCGGNYGASFLPTQKARLAGYDQVLWTDAKEHKFIEESGMMNVMFVINNILVTAPLSDSILDGVTRDSLLTLAKTLGIKTEERPIAVAELEQAFTDGTITEAFGVGTAAVVAPIKMININGIDYRLPKYDEGKILYKLKNKLEQIRLGIDADDHNWNCII